MKTQTTSDKRCSAPPLNGSRIVQSGTNPVQQKANQRQADDFALDMIFVPVDFSAGSLKALDFAVALARRMGASIMLLHALAPIYLSGKFDSPRLRPLRAQAFEDAKRRLATLSRRRVRRHVPVRHQVIKGADYAVIIEAAAKTKADLIVMGSEGRSGVNRFLVGSVAEKVFRHAHCPVLIVRNQRRSDSSKRT
jgi:universal stress protein A